MQSVAMLPKNKFFFLTMIHYIFQNRFFLFGESGANIYLLPGYFVLCATITTLMEGMSLFVISYRRALFSMSLEKDDFARTFFFCPPEKNSVNFLIH